VLGFKIPYSVAEIEAAAEAVLRENNLVDAYVRPVAWRGSEMMGVSAQATKINLAIAAWPWPSYFSPELRAKGIRLNVSSWRRPAPDTAPVHAKAAGLYMICTMSKHAAEAKGCSDAMMFDYRGYVAEATGANIFFVKDGEVHTPLPDCFLNGLTRQTVIGMLKDKQVKVHERHIQPAELESFQQCWLTGTAAEVTPVGQIGEFSFEVGQMTRDIATDYEKVVRA
jgi:branched-chain amino acid aminotransferase